MINCRGIMRGSSKFVKIWTFLWEILQIFMQPNIFLQIVVDLYSFNTKVDHVALRQILENVIKTKDKSSPVVKAR